MSVDLDRQLRQYCRDLDEKQGVLTFDDILERTGELQVVTGRPNRRSSPRFDWIVASASAAFVVLVVAIGIQLLTNIDVTSETTWTGPVHEDTADLGIITMEESDTGDESWSWEDPKDAAFPWVDITGTVAGPGRWQIELSGWPDQDDAIPDGAVISHGMVVETDGDSVADYVLGIDELERGGPYRVWITDLTTGETIEQTGPPYGDPFDFAHPGERLEGDPAASPPTVHLFPVGAAPPAVFTVRANRFYAWASLTVDGDVVAWDYAPDSSWLGIAESEQTPGPSSPEMEPGARMLIIPVENTSGEAAELFVALDTQPMGSLVGTAAPSVVEPGDSEEVTFTVPDGEGWAIFVNSAPLIISGDIPADASGELPITIFIGQDGSAGVGTPADLGPGWFGNP